MRKSYLIASNYGYDWDNYFHVIPVDGETEISWSVTKAIGTALPEPNFEYSINRVQWLPYTNNTTITTTNPVYFRGTNTTFNNYSNNQYQLRTYLVTNKVVDLAGCISSIVANVPDNTAECAYGIGGVNNGFTWGDYSGGLFQDNNKLRSIKNLNLDLVLPTRNSAATRMDWNDYNNMFNSCSIIDTPIISSVLTGLSCQNIFANCNNLTTIYDLPTPTGNGCYQYAFKSCEGLTSIPQHLLDYTSLAPNCYSFMFANCSNLETIPQNLLPATTLSEGCYSGMFYGCEELTTSCVLPATNLPNNCYKQMFYGCKKLENIPALSVTNIYGDALWNMYGNALTFNTNGISATNWIYYRIPTSGTATYSGSVSYPSENDFVCLNSADSRYMGLIINQQGSIMNENINKPLTVIGI